MNPGKLSELSREELFEKVWSTPASNLRKELGVSDVAIGKQCKKLNIPKPPRGHWAKLVAGKTSKRPRLPPAPDEIFEAKSAKAIQTLPKRLVLPQEDAPLHSLAAEYLKELNTARLSYDRKRLNLKQPAFPETEISKALANRAARAFHVLLEQVEPHGIHFRKAQSSYDGGHFRNGNDRLFFKIVELLEGETDSTRMWATQTKAKPSGRLTFSLNADRYSHKDVHTWTESPHKSIEVVLSDTARCICSHFLEQQKRRM